MLRTLKEIEAQIGSADLELTTRIVEIPVLYNDPWTRETLMRFRERHQDPKSTDIEYAARINGYSSIDEFIAAHSGAPWFVSMVGFVAGLPFLFQMVERAKQIEVPKYLRPRTDTPKLTVGHGGCFGCIYSVRGAGGYQMFGITPAPIYDPAQKLPYLRDFMAFFRPGDIVKWKPISREEYERDVKAVEAGTFDLTIRPVSFSLKAFHSDPGLATAEVWWRCSMDIEVIKPGLATSVQDAGRPGYYNIGIPLVGGARSIRVARGESFGCERRGRRRAREPPCWAQSSSFARRPSSPSPVLKRHRRSMAKQGRSTSPSPCGLTIG